jgi:hypothetical protein|tara:strand:+ start:990 stop:1139 length:150 start_codon:yes stop_codon:yes gene_type:complete
MDNKIKIMAWQNLAWGCIMAIKDPVKKQLMIDAYEKLGEKCKVEETSLK